MADAQKRLEPAHDIVCARDPAEPAQDNVTVHVGRGVAKRLRQGHPWLFDGGIEKQQREGEAGSVAVVFDDRRKMVGLGLYDPGHPIRVKMLCRGGGVPIDAAFFASRVEALRRCVQRFRLLEPTATGSYTVRATACRAWWWTL